MNQFHETRKNKEHITYRRVCDEYDVVEVDTERVTFHDIPWKELGGFGKRKFENLLVLEYPMRRIKIRYA